MTARDVYTNKALIAVCEAIEEWELTPQETRNLVANILEELDGRAEAAYERHQAALMESGGHDDSAYRRQMREAGRGHLLK